ncbi:hypothetical protein CKA55_04085 [Arcobacter suis]|uniref:Uncharacterized protein n=1 Tax=Arcobacter suis CECT 7833 TaxID=663365 RepID=A0AAD0WQR1_9BACT|nr:hypothetical protein [Arcobacter suis]AXX90045.1 hypothetical protein ASUIS_1566 [Arcobacter suis CECT 7833]RWS47177.1 hypothetical protein CKA55_04085 [Arcobacter suis]
MAKSQAEIFENKLLEIIKNQNNIYDFIVEYVNEKSYGTFRIFSKKLKELNQKLFNENSISEEEYIKINNAISNKVKTRSPEVTFDMEAFFKKYIEFFEINKKDNKNLLNILFLMLPFLFVKSFKELHEIKIEDIEIHEFNKCMIIKHNNPLTGKNHTVKIGKFYKEWLYLFNSIKMNEKEEYLFAHASSNYTVFNQKLDPYLSNFANKNITDTKYITLIKNALKYSKKSIFEIL